MYQTETDICDLSNFTRIIKRISRCLMRKEAGDCDKLAQSRDDYEAILLARAWESMMKWREDPARRNQGEAAERRYVYASLWTQAHLCERLRLRDKTNIQRLPFYERELLDEEFEGWMFVKHDIAVAFDCLDSSERDAIYRYVTTGLKGPAMKQWRVCQRAQELLRHRIMSL